MWGALVWIVAEIWLSDMTGPWPAAALSTAAFLGSGAAAAALAGNARRRVRTMDVMAMAGHYDPLSAAARNKLEKLANSLLEADDRLEQGQISAIDYELAWWQVYDQMAPDSAAWPVALVREERVMAELFQVLALMAAPTAILLTIRFIIVRQARQAGEPAMRIQSAVRRA